MSLDSPPSSDAPTAARPVPRPLDRIERRIVGVLVEKAKTTPDAYPMSLNALTAGCNQKSSRDPRMELTEDEVRAGLDRLRQLGAVAEVQGNGRVPRFRHYMYEWLGVDKVELAVMTELLLRGAQTVGELRGRAARMEPIPDLHALMPVIRRLIEKQLVVSLTPEGRGQIVMHTLLNPDEMAKVRRRLPLAEGADTSRADDSFHAERDSLAPVRGEAASRGQTPARDEVRTHAFVAEPTGGPNAAAAGLRDELVQLRNDNESLRIELRETREALDQLRYELDDLRSKLGA